MKKTTQKKAIRVTGARATMINYKGLVLSGRRNAAGNMENKVKLDGVLYTCITK